MDKSTVLLLSGTGRYADPWHPFTETSSILAGELESAGLSVTTADDVDGALSALEHPGQWPDMLAVNVGLPRDSKPSPGTSAAGRGLDEWIAGGRPLLACHSSSTTFIDAPLWEEALGGRWVHGTSMHPEYGRARIEMHGDTLARGMSGFTLSDERYTRLRTAPTVTVHARHRHDGGWHPLVWTHRRGEARTFYDALGHDAASFDSPEHRELLRRGIEWLVAGMEPRR